MVVSVVSRRFGSFSFSCCCGCDWCCLWGFFSVGRFLEEFELVLLVFGRGGILSLVLKESLRAAVGYISRWRVMGLPKHMDTLAYCNSIEIYKTLN